MMPLVEASRQSILKSIEKDVYYLNILKHNVNDVCQRILGAQFWIHWKKEIEVGSQLLYYFVTTVQGLQTLGEEYVEAVQVNSNSTNIPSLLERIAMVMLQCVSPYMLEKFLLLVLDNLRKVEGATDAEIKYCTSVITFIHKFIPVACNVHLMAFYVWGTYASISKRVIGVKYVISRQRFADEYDYPVFYILASLLAIQILTSTYTLINDTKIEISEEEKKNLKVDDLCRSLVPRKQVHVMSCKCILCLEQIEETSVTQCGHVFCWKCIVQWCTVKSECPTCREQCIPSKVIRLHHFSC